MGKIGLITVRYGLEINGGAEFHCRMLAERLAPQNEIDVLTTTIRNYVSFENPFPTGEEVINQIKVLRFSNTEYDHQRFRQAEKKAKWSRKIRRLIFRFKLSSVIFKLFPVWNFKITEEYELMRLHKFYSKDLIDYIKARHHEYDALIFFSYENPLTQLGIMVAPQKSILMPAAHLEGMLFRSINSHSFTKAAFIAFNTDTERQMCHQLFQHKMSPNSVVAVGTTLSEPENAENIKKNYPVPEHYILYSGRVTSEKLNSLINDFLQYKQQNPGDLRLVLTGDIMMEKTVSDEIVYMGFVPEPVKTYLMMHAMAIINPSTVESLSLLTLEALSLGKFIIANKKCNVMREHERKSNGAVQCYSSFVSFTTILNMVVNYPEKLIEIRKNAEKYVEDNYNWDKVIRQYQQVFDNIKESERN
ncbi:glycosyltransferase, group 1 family protein [Sphingobacterium spiritivorum ATCC 33300]|uniref:Glycosyltransferase, group 1 family protein n=1 Tax=Sphingobacterium spiritivorum ATCC 33300 TaxID=525372 RepID=C2FWL0_SPHSI|nr:glycosyltransferase [Sphingobacterium spiritivorum]EEI92624.1 glycosyltransferase, group 1 family protein [Sphingobacterium spiritivorum ATCC 33300]QQS94182.1 glycosyltransferase [Sphingobacterium spiritivorum]